MKLICIHKCQFRGLSIKKGALVEASEADLKTEPAKSSFVLADHDVKPTAPADEQKPDPTDLTDEEMRRRLNEWGLTIPPKLKRAELVKLYNSQLQLQDEK